MTHRIVLASDTHPDYAFFLPLTALIWHSRGWSPSVILVGGEGQWNSSAPLRDALHATREVAGSLCHLSSPLHPLSRTSTWAQVSRLFGHLTPGISDDDLLMTSDVDMWPIGSWVLTPRIVFDEFRILGANANVDERGRPVRFPICYLAARTSTWREVVGEYTSIAAAVDATLTVDQPSMSGTHRGVPLTEWCLDEVHFFQCLRKWAGWPDRCHLVERDLQVPGQQRLDRAAWQDHWQLSDYADAHLLRPGFTDEHWPRLRRLLAELIPPAYLRWADGYRARWVA